ncbi:MAG: hypothetical protein IT212_07790 [Bacteroidia bacterium]|nr:hypothetical protein [Bacteroidia bacterium]
MKINEITYSQTIQAEPFHPINISATATVNEGETPDHAMYELKRFVVTQLDEAFKSYWDKKSGKTSTTTAVKDKLTDVEKELNEVTYTKSVVATPKKDIPPEPIF